MIKQHVPFIESILDSRGYSIDSWNHIASEIGWSVTDAQMEYMKHLRDNHQTITVAKVKNGGVHICTFIKPPHGEMFSMTIGYKDRKPSTLEYPNHMWDKKISEKISDGYLPLEIPDVVLDTWDNIQTIYSRHRQGYHVYYTTDFGYTWKTVPEDTGKWKNDWKFVVINLKK